MSNIEIKVRCDDLDSLRARVVQLPEVEDLGVETQRDTYFHTPAGRLKLRESSRVGAELIPYLRVDSDQARVSEYQRVAIVDPGATLLLFERLLGIRCVVSKTRELFLYRGVRIHLDRVDGLGSFMELEGVCGPELSAEVGHQRVQELLTELEIDPSQHQSLSYGDLILALREPS